MSLGEFVCQRECYRFNDLVCVCGFFTLNSYGFCVAFNYTCEKSQNLMQSFRMIRTSPKTVAREPPEMSGTSSPVIVASDLKQAWTIPGNHKENGGRPTERIRRSYTGNLLRSQKIYTKNNCTQQSVRKHHRVTKSD